MLNISWYHFLFHWRRSFWIFHKCKVVHSGRSRKNVQIATPSICCVLSTPRFQAYQTIFRIFSCIPCQVVHLSKKLCCPVEVFSSLAHEHIFIILVLGRRWLGLAKKCFAKMHKWFHQNTHGRLILSNRLFVPFRINLTKIFVVFNRRKVLKEITCLWTAIKSLRLSYFRLTAIFMRLFKMVVSEN